MDGGGEPNALILLVGTNPLPVWVAFEALGGLEGRWQRTILLHTAETEKISIRLRKRMEKFGVAAQAKSINAVEPVEIRNATRETLAKLDDGGIRSAHLHYTGGTKAMGVHAHEALRAWKADRNNWQAETSYLDHQRHRIMTSNGDVLIGDAREKVRLEITDIAELHDFTSLEPICDEVKKPPPDENPPTEAAVVLGNSFFDDRIWENFKNWKNGVKGKNDPVVVIDKRDSHLKATAWPFSKDPQLENVPELLNREFAGGQPAWKNHQFDATDPAVAKRMGGFLNGTWLELYVFACLRKALEEIGRGGYRLYHSVSVQRDPNQKCFELDVVALLGYQMVAVSCKTSGSEKAAKLAGFEVRVRSQQLGGDEAKGLLVCAHDRDDKGQDVPLRIQEELQQDTGVPTAPVKVWGRTTWGRLPEKFGDLLRDLHWE